MKKRKTTRDFWMHHYHSFKESGLRQTEYCRQNNLTYWTFNKWKRELDDENNSTDLQCLPVKINPIKNERIEIILQNNLTISIPEHFSEMTLSKILLTLRNEK